MAGTSHSSKNNLQLLKKSSHKGHKFLNAELSKFSRTKYNKNFSMSDTKDVHTDRADKQALLIVIFCLVPFSFFVLYLLGMF